jgi:hypothetical protein
MVIRESFADLLTCLVSMETVFDRLVFELFAGVVEAVVMWCLDCQIRVNEQNARDMAEAILLQRFDLDVGRVFITIEREEGRHVAMALSLCALC